MFRVLRGYTMTSLLYLPLLLAIVVPSLAEIEMKFTKYPESVTAPVGDEVTFECEVRVPAERLSWRWKPVDKPDDDWKEVVGTSDKERVSSRLVVQVKEDTPNSLYQCVVRYGALGLASIPARLTIAKLDLSKNTSEKRVITAPLHNTVILHCKEPFSEPPAVLSWWKELAHGTKKQIETQHGVLVIRNATTEDSGVYGCTATNELSSQVLDLPEKTYLRVEHEGRGNVRFLETEDYVGTLDNERVLTVPIRPHNTLRLWCGAVGTPPPRITWTREGGKQLPGKHDHMLTVEQFTPEDEGVYSCTANGFRRSWKVIALRPPHWEGAVASVSVSEGASAHVACGVPLGQPQPKVHWLLNAKLLKTGKGIRATGSDLFIDRVEKRHAGVVQCFACNQLICSYDAAMITVVPVQISDQDYSAEAAKTLHFPSQPPKRHNRKNSRKHKAVMIPPSRPNVTRMSDSSVMVSWTNANQGLPIQFFKVQFKDATNSSITEWHTVDTIIPSHIHSYLVDGLTSDRYYKFRIAAVYSNQDNDKGPPSGRFYLQSGGFQSPRPPVITKAVSLSPNSIQVNWTWSNGGGIEADGFYVYYRAVSSAGPYEKVTAPGGVLARSIVLSHLVPDTAYEFKVQSYTAQAPSDFSTILVSKTLRAASAPGTTSKAPVEEPSEGEGVKGALVTAGGMLGASLLVILAVTFLLCRRARRSPLAKEKGQGLESGGTNGYIPAKVPITITANPMHTEGGDGGVEMSFLHNNNCGNTGSNDDSLQHSRKNGPTPRQYV